MKKYLVFLIVVMFFFTNCSKDDNATDTNDPVPVLVGMDGNPRFNLNFTNPENVDLDLYVKTPNDVIIYFGNLTGDSGQLDVDCLCDDCPEGPNENIYWEDGTAPTGTYEYWVEYYDYCTTEGSASNYTVRVIKNGVVLVTKTGTLNSEGSTAHWTFQLE